MHGVLVVDKPAGMTSHDVVDRVREIAGTRKVGHLGTLDPAATGVLPVAVGKATRLARYIPTSPKEYSGQIRLGWDTTTGDAEGEPLGEHPVNVTEEAVRAAMAELTGKIDQMPPAYSAKKIAGVAAYKLARRGRPADLHPAPVEVYQFALVRFESPNVWFHVVCSAGTYVRSLARDVGQILGCRGHLASLRRTRTGVFSISDARPLDQAVGEDVIPSATVMAGSESVVIDDADLERVRNGSRVAYPGDSPMLCILNKNGELIAIGVAEKGWAHPKVVLI